MMVPRRIYKATTPTGTVERFTNISEFAKRHGFQAYQLYLKNGEKSKTFRGYEIRVFRVLLTEPEMEKLDQRVDGAHQGYQVDQQRKKRSCLRCRREFLSTWVGHRLCQPCHESSDYRTANML